MGLELARAFIRIRADSSRLNGDLNKVRRQVDRAMKGAAKRRKDVEARTAARGSGGGGDKSRNKETLDLMTARRVAVRTARKDESKLNADLMKMKQGLTAFLKKQDDIKLKSAENLNKTLFRMNRGLTAFLKNQEAARTLAGIKAEKVRVAAARARAKKIIAGIWRVHKATLAAEKAGAAAINNAIKKELDARKAKTKKIIAGIRRVHTATMAAEKARVAAARAVTKTIIAGIRRRHKAALAADRAEVASKKAASAKIIAKIRRMHKAATAGKKSELAAAKVAEKGMLALLTQRRIAIKQANVARLAAIRKTEAAERVTERNRVKAIRVRRANERVAERSRLRGIRVRQVSERAAERRRLQAIRREKKATQQLGLFTSLAATGGAAIGVGLVSGAVLAAAQFEQLEVSLETLLGGVDKSKRKIEELQQFAAKTPFTIPGIEAAARSLLGVGFKADELLPTLKALGDVSAGLGRGEDGLRRLIHNMGQVRAQHKLTGRELRDFAILGVPILETLSMIIFGTEDAVDKVQSMVQAGNISSALVSQAFKKMSSAGGLYANLMLKQNKTVLGLFSNIKDQIIIAARALGVDFLGAIKSVERVIISFTKSIRKFIQDSNGMAGAALLGASAFMVLTAAILAARVAMVFLGITFKTVLIATGWGAVIVAIGAAIGILVNAIVKLMKGTERGEQATQNLIQAWNTLKEAAVIIFNSIGDLFENIFGVRFLDSIVSVEDGFLKLLVKASETAISIANGIKEAADLIAFFMRNASEIAQIAMIDLELGIIKLLPSTEIIFQKIGTFIIATFDGVGAFFTAFIDNIKAGFTELKNLATAVFTAVGAGASAAFAGKDPLEAMKKSFIETLAGQKDAEGGGNPFVKFKEAFDKTTKEAEEGFKASGGLGALLEARKKALQDKINQRELERSRRKEEEGPEEKEKEKAKVVADAVAEKIKFDRSGFLEFGTKIQDALLKTETDGVDKTNMLLGQVNGNMKQLVNQGKNKPKVGLGP